nr:hypothetical protein [Tanacetum cinerariifolium]
MEKTIGELNALLIEYEKGLLSKGCYTTNHPTQDHTCHHCKEVGHCKRNCPSYLAELIKKKKQVGTTNSSDIFVIELFSFPTKFWVYDTSCGNHICNTKHGLRGDYALKIATHILNMVPIKKVDKTQYELWYEKVPNLSYLKRKILYLKKSVRPVQLEEIQDEDTPPSENTSEIPMEVECFEPPQEEVIPVRRSVRTHRAPERLCLNVEVEEHSLGDLNEPTNYNAILFDLEFDRWLDAINVKKQSMKDNQVWCLVDLPPNYKTVGSKWLFKKKTDMDGNVHTYKARLVAKDFTQTYGVDYEETFSPVADIRAIRILIAIAAFYDYEIWQMDVKIVLLNGYLDEDIFMVYPEGFVDPNHPRKASGSNVTFLILYVDDIIILRNHIPSLQSVNSYLGKCFTMKDLKKAAFILGINIYRDRSKRLIRLSQSAYMDKMLKRNRMDNSKRGYIPMQERLDLNKTQVLQHSERPDVAFTQNITSRFQQNPGEPHWTNVKPILKHLRHTKDMFLVYGRNPKAKLQVDCYCNAGFKTDRDDRQKYSVIGDIKSLTGYVFVLNESTVD